MTMMMIRAVQYNDDDDHDAQCSAVQYLLDEGNTFYCLATFVFLSA